MIVLFWSLCFHVCADATNRPLPREGHVMVKGPFEETTSFTIHGGMGYGYVPYEDVSDEVAYVLR